MPPVMLAAAGAVGVFIIFLALSRVMAGNASLESRVQEFARRPEEQGKAAGREKLTARTDRAMSSSTGSTWAIAR